MALPEDYAERVYAGVLGKLIGVYLGRPFEGWSYERIMRELGEIYYYVHERRNVPLIVTDDDISGTFTFLRALPDHGNRHDLSAAEIGLTWLNYLIEERTVLWWGGLGNSTEHTAYLRLKAGIPAPRSGSIALNGRVVAEQIGAQIFVDGWAMVAPGDPELAVHLAQQAASVSHDGEAVYGAQVLAAMEAQAFVERDLNRLIDTAVSFIPADSIIYRMIEEIREQHQQEPDWRKTREWIAAHYGYDRYGGNCHMIPNHALIIFALLYGNDDFQKSLMIVNTSGWDTDCNSGNVGCFMGIKNGLAGIEDGPDWRGPIADRLYLPTADGGRAITDAVTETYHIVNIGRTLANQSPLAPKNGARFHFELPGAVQGFQAEDSPEVRGTLTLENVEGHSHLGKRSLALHYGGVTIGRTARAATPTFIPSFAVARHFELGGYGLLASPTLHSGQIVRARVEADDANQQATTCRLYIQVYGTDDELEIQRGPGVTLEPGASHEFHWQIEGTDGAPIAWIGLEIVSESRVDGVIYLDYLTWGGTPQVTLKRPACGGTMWRRAWVNAADMVSWQPQGPDSSETYRIMQNEGRGMLMQGSATWENYQASAEFTPHLCNTGGIAVRVQGLRRYYALLLHRDGVLRIVKYQDEESVLTETSVPMTFGRTYLLSLEANGSHLVGRMDDEVVIEAEDDTNSLTAGGVGLICEAGRVAFGDVIIQ